MRKPAGTSTAAQLLQLRPEDAARNSRRLTGQAAATHFWDPSSRAGAVIVAEDGTFLFADPAVSPDQHLDWFLSGQRTKHA